MSEHFDEHHQHHEHHEGEEHHHEHHGEDHNNDQHHQENNGGAAHNDNGYVVVPPTPQSSVTHDENQVSSSSAVENVIDLLTSEDKQEELSRMLADIGSSAESKLNSLTETIKAEADSSSTVTKPAEKEKEKEKEKPKSSCESSSTCGKNANFLCPYYMMAMDRLSKVEVPPKVKDLLLWKDLKLTGAVFGSSFVLLVSIAWFSLLTVVSALALTAMTVVGSYRFYLALIFRIKGTYDNTFDKLSAQDVSLPKDKVKNLSHLLETDVNRAINKLKSILLWDNITTSGIAFSAFYVVYCIGCWFNTITLLILALVSAFTLPKVYDVYKKPIDQALEKATSMIHQTVKQIITKVPMLNKKKTQ